MTAKPPLGSIVRLPANALDLNPGLHPLVCPCGSHDAELSREGDDMTLECKGCDRKVAAPMRIPGNCKSEKMYQRQIAKHVQLLVRRWNEGDHHGQDERGERGGDAAHHQQGV